MTRSIGVGDGPKWRRSIPLSVFLISLSTYPLEIQRLRVGQVFVPVSAGVFAFLVALSPFFRAVPTDERSHRVSLLCLLLFVLFATVTCFNLLIGEPITATNFKSIPYVLAPIVIARMYEPSMNRFHVWCAMTALLVPTVIGTQRFFTGAGGIEPEHAIGYWGIRYLPSTRNSDVVYPLFALIFALALAFRSRALGTRFLLFGLAAFSSAAVVLSYSRGAWLAAIGGVMALIGLRGRALLLSVTGAALIAMGGIGAAFWAQSRGPEGIESVAQRFGSIFSGKEVNGYSNASRLLLSRLTLEGIATHPLGVGIENFEALFSGQDRPGNAENAYLNIAGEGGLPALLAFVALLLTLKSGHDLGNERKGALGNALVGTLAVYFLFNAELNSLLTWSLLGLASALGTTGHRESRVQIVPAYSNIMR